ncbi:MAG: hypothetical protein M1825_002118 [Sarcosagium campestre]|nr:MAG: hypothetical protein M1825_002118 [Sarcosagium campestre]
MGLATACGFIGNAIWQANNGVGRHIIAVPKPTIAAYAIQILYPLTLTFTKLSILLLYWRLFPTRGFRLGTYIVGAIVVIWWLEVELVTIFQCKPISYLWDKSGKGRCLDLRGAFSIANAPPNIGIDVILLAMPIGKVWQLRVEKRVKIALSGVFLLGSFVIACSAVRLYYLATLDFASDSTWNQSTFHIWTALEPAIAVVCACLPVMKPLIVGTKNRITGRKTGSGYGGSSFGKWSGNQSKGSDKGPSHRDDNDSSVGLKDMAAKGQDPWLEYTTKDVDVHNKVYSDSNGNMTDTHHHPHDIEEGRPGNGIEVKTDLAWNENKSARSNL